MEKNGDEIGNYDEGQVDYPKVKVTQTGSVRFGAAMLDQDIAGIKPGPHSN
jgi:hypothetical protein